jgi:putative heme-binding domain-containing protein
MTRFRSVLLLGLLSLAATALLAAQEKEVRSPQHPGKNPYLGDKQGIRDGMALYRVRCADCHGLDATGYRGPDLIALLGGGVKDEGLFQSIRKGVTGTEMPSSNAPDHELLMMIAYLRNIGTVAAPATPVGNAENGAKLFAAQCANCHQVAGKGGRIGPDLSRIGTARSHAAFVREIRTPAEWIPPAFETVTLVTKDGQKVRGVKKNEDVFSIQVMDVRERIQGYLKADLQDIIYDKGSLMPAFGPERLSDSALNDVIGYLTTLRGVDVTVR